MKTDRQKRISFSSHVEKQFTIYLTFPNCRQEVMIKSRRKGNMLESTQWTINKVKT